MPDRYTTVVPKLEAVKLSRSKRKWSKVFRIERKMFRVMKYAAKGQSGIIVYVCCWEPIVSNYWSKYKMAGSLRRIEDIEERTGRKSNMDKPLFFPNYKWFKRLKFTLCIWSVRVPDLRSFWLARFGLEPQFQKATSHRDLSLPICAHTPQKTRPWGRKNIQPVDAPAQFMNIF